MQKVPINLNSGTVDAAKRIDGNALKACEVDHNKAFIDIAMGSAIIGILVLMTVDSSKIQEPLKYAVIQGTTSLRWSTTIVVAMVLNAAVIAPKVRFVAETILMDIDESVRDIFHTSLFPPLFGLDSSPNNSQKGLKKGIVKKEEY